MAMINQSAKRTATMAAKDDVEVLSLSRDDFNKLSKEMTILQHVL
jgi:CRP-like cAMP-binding protein